jgi:hypothetical protein
MHLARPRAATGIFAPATPQLSRRVVLKAAAILGAIYSGAHATNSGRVAVAQELPPVSSSDWVESEHLGGITATTGAVVVQAPFPFTAVGANWPV